MLKKALVISVGTGTRADVNIVNPLVKTVTDSRPDYTVFVVSDISKNNALEIVNRLRLGENTFHICCVDDHDNLQKVFKNVNAVFNELAAKGYPAEVVTVDYTSGTKAMTGGVVLSAIFNSCDVLKYITGERKEGIVQDGTERFLSVPPKGIFAKREINTALQLITEMRFASAKKILREINLALLDDAEKGLHEQISLLAEAYGCWDNFEHFGFFSTYKKIRFTSQELQEFKTKSDVRDQLLKMAKKLKNGEMTPGLILDVYNNAVRRFAEGRYDDALARLYRITEMLAQFILYNRFGIDTSDVECAKVPDGYRESLEQARDRSSGKIKIGLRRAWDLLHALGYEAARCFVDNEKLQGILNQRNQSIFAHGTSPISETACLSLFGEVNMLIANEIEGFKQLAVMSQFPWLQKMQSELFEQPAEKYRC